MRRPADPGKNSVTASAQKPQIRIPGYQFERLLGRGGMAAVYLAIQESFGREVAIKVLEPTQAKAENFSERFLREAKIVSRLSHPNIVTVYDVGIHKGYHYYSMEYVDGPNLKEALPALSLKHKLRIIKDVARALDFAGKKGYVHRDVKPENIMLRKSDGHVVLTDFGIARGDDLSMTQTGKAIGTPHYMSPEQTKGLSVDPRSDIYSLGVVLFQMLSGHVPYDADSAIAVGIKHLSTPIPSLPPDMKIFQPIINTSLSKDPGHRYQSAGELIAALDAITPQQIAAIEAKTPRPGTSQHDMHAATVADIDYNAATQALNEMTSGTHTPTSTPVPASSRVITARQPVPRRKRRSTGMIWLLLIGVLGSIGAGAWFGREEITRIWQTLGLPTMDEIVTSVTDDAPSPDKTISAKPESVVVEPATTPAAVDPIQYMYRQLEADPANAKIVAQAYRARMAGELPDPEARQGMNLMHEWFTEQLKTAFDNYDAKRARQLVDAMQQSFPHLAATPRFAQIKSRLEEIETVQIYLDQAEQYLQQQALIEPPGANALDAYRSALKLMPGHPLAQQGLTRITDIFHNQAIEHQTQGELQMALNKVNTGLSISTDDAELQALQKQLKQEIENQRKIAAWLKQGDEAFARGNLLQPANRSAFHYYQLAVKLDPGNHPAQKGLLKIQQQELLKVQFEIRKRRFKEARAMLNELQGWFGKTPSINNSWDTLSHAIKESLPEITRLAYSDLEVKSLNVTRPSVLKPVRNLYFGFAYKNLPVREHQVDAYLMDATGQVAMAHKTLTLQRAEGEHFDNLLLPITEMQDGRYKLVLLLDGKPLQQASLYIDTQP